jgi:hypothetical protein
VHARAAVHETCYLDHSWQAGAPLTGVSVTPGERLGAVREWDEQRTRTETLGLMAIRMAELDGIDGLPPDDVEANDARVAQFVADHVEPARSKAYHAVGDGRRALSIAVGWLRPRVARAD